MTGSGCRFSLQTSGSLGWVKARRVPIGSDSVSRCGKRLWVDRAFLDLAQLGKNYIAERTTKHPRRRGSSPVPSSWGTKLPRERTVSS